MATDIAIMATPTRIKNNTKLALFKGHFLDTLEE